MSHQHTRCPQILIEKEWLAFGHKFTDRCGHIQGDPKEVSPIFTQFIGISFGWKIDVWKSLCVCVCVSVCVCVCLCSRCMILFTTIREVMNVKVNNSDNDEKYLPFFCISLSLCTFWSVVVMEWVCCVPDCVWQLQQILPSAFEFNERYLLVLHDHVFSCQFGTFIGNCQKDRVDLR